MRLKVCREKVKDWSICVGKKGRVTFMHEFSSYKPPFYKGTNFIGYTFSLAFYVNTLLYNPFFAISLFPSVN